MTEKLLCATTHLSRQVMLDIELKCTGEVAIFKWNLPTLPTRGLLRCSPLIEKFNRKWRLLLTDKAVCLEYIQGVHPIHMHVRYVDICKKNNVSNISDTLPIQEKSP